MRILFTIAFLAASTLLLVSGLPVSQHDVLCPSLPVALELRTSGQLKNKFELVFASVDPTKNAYQQADFVDIHYRVNNDDSVNLRVLTHDAITNANQPAKQAKIDGITLQPGDALRAYATYSAKGYACDTPIHTFSAPEILDQHDVEMMDWNQPIRRTTRPPQPHHQMVSNVGMHDNEDVMISHFVTQAALISSGVLDQTAQEVDVNTACPSIPLNQDIVKIAGLDNTYMLTFENANPIKQLHYVDLHVSTDAGLGWDNLRLASDMQLANAHKVMQPGIVVKPNETLKWYWSYRTTNKDNSAVVDCTTPVMEIAPQQISHQVTLADINKLGRSA